VAPAVTGLSAPRGVGFSSYVLFGTAALNGLGAGLALALATSQVGCSSPPAWLDVAIRAGAVAAAVGTTFALSATAARRATGAGNSIGRSAMAGVGVAVVGYAISLALLIGLYTPLSCAAANVP
jgi:hypothetical protein